jgi:PAS domain S-box-containing protein
VGAKQSSAELRRRAEERLRKAPASRAVRPGPADGAQLAAELRVHEVELELQNEELRASRNELECALDEYTQLFDFAPIGYFVVGVDGGIEKVNLSGASLVGVERSRLKGLSLLAMVHAASIQVLQRVLVSICMPEAHDPTRPAEVCEIALRWKEIDRHVRVTATRLPALSDAVPRALLAVEDVTERKRAVEALREADRRKDEFLAMLSHELRNPLMPIRNASYILDHAQPGGPEADRARDVLRRQSEHLTRLVDDLLDVTRIARGRISLHPSMVDLHGVASRVADDLRPSMAERGIAFRVELPEAELRAYADPMRVTQVITNILHNAAKFTPRGGAVVLSLERAGEAAELRVRDTGAGIDGELLPRVFEPFVQGDRTLARSEGGLGVGLALVKAIVELHGGEVRAESAGPGRGTEVVMSLPLRAQRGGQP